ncbi:hypothetical protein PHLGIDRAFT_85936 [Phlebiopsis gigantea 11061_1 CR5-6]|uniref:Uncharacterized protein n=1 Tax=Phlebiopsis gigantea (strain 11061_1 CR5-6) TaxID=745531 RepID=A0A0C3NX11_PHLG1|nr:hypothetical protein PHLGIDRAFT_85936 [Phlebiopsis gigantea 11061_1 CR5-6]
MPTCINLAKLPPAPSHIKSVNFRNTTPGSVKRLLNPAWARLTEFDGFVDSKHPAARMSRSELLRKLPMYKGPHFDMKVFPKAALAHPSTPWPSPPRKLAPDVWPDERRINISLNMLASVKPLNNQVVRRKVKNKMRNAVHLLLTRNPVIKTDETGVQVVKWGDGAKPHAVLQDWTYLIYTRPEIYGLSYPTLIYELKRAFYRLLRPCQQLQQSWEMQYPGVRSYLTKTATSPATSANSVMNLLQSSLPAEVLEDSQELMKDWKQPTQNSSDDDWKILLRDISEDLERGETKFDEGLELDEMSDMDYLSFGNSSTLGLPEDGLGTSPQKTKIVSDFDDPSSSYPSADRHTSGSRSSSQPRPHDEPQGSERPLSQTNRPRRVWPGERKPSAQYPSKRESTPPAPQASRTPTRINPMEKLFAQKPILSPGSSSKNKR